MTSSKDNGMSRIWRGDVEHRLSRPPPREGHDVSETLVGVELWSDRRMALGRSIDGARLTSVAYVDVLTVPLHFISGGVLRVFTSAQSTVDFLEELAALGSVGLLLRVDDGSDAHRQASIEASQTESRRYSVDRSSSASSSTGPSRTLPDFFLVYAEAESVCALPLTVDMHLDELLAMKVEDGAVPTFIERPTDTTGRTSRAMSILDRVLSTQSRQTTPFDLAIKSKSQTAGSNIYAPTGPRAGPVPAGLPRSIMTGLRMAGIDKRHPEYRQLYQHTHRTVAFAVRSRPDIGAVDLQVMVDRVLSLFLGKDW